MKRYYDIFTWFLTHAAFSFTVAPFYLLTLPNSLAVWARVYFYAVVGVAVSFGLFSTPAKAYLVKELKKRNPELAAGKESRPGLERTESKDSMRTTLGVPNDPEREVDEIVAEVKKEIETLKKRGVHVRSDDDIQRLVDKQVEKRGL